MREVLEVDLVHDADAGRDDLEAIEGLHPPLEELVAGAVALELDPHVQLDGICDAGEVDLHAVVDHQIDRHLRLDDFGVAPRPVHRAAHGCEVDDERDAGEILQEDAGDDERDLVGPFALRLPAGEGLDVRVADPFAVHVAQERLEHDAQAEREPGDRLELLRQLRKGVELAVLERLLELAGHGGSPSRAGI